LVVEVQAKTSKFTTGMKAATVGLAALGAGAAYAFGQFEESEKVAAQTNAVLTSTGNAANITAQEIQGLSTALSEKSGIDDEVIQSGENMLLTFTHIRNEVGAGNDIFAQASATALDVAAGMAAASGGAVDLKATSIQLGKALNDPVEGLSSLKRVGIDVAAVQAQMTKAQLAGNDTLGAQKVILAELNKEFAGSAAANATDSMKMQVAMENLAESVGGVLAPAINTVISGLTPVFGFMERFPGVIVAVVGVVGLLTAAWLAQKVAAGVVAAQQVVLTTITIAQNAAMIASSVAIGVVTAAQWLWNAALTANPIGLVIVAIAAAIAIIAVLIRHFHLTDDIMNVLKKTFAVVWTVIKAVVSTAIKLIVFQIKIWIAVIGAVIKVIATVAPAVGRAFMAAFNFVKEWLGKIIQINLQIWTSIIRFFASLGGKLARAGRGMWDWIWDGLKGVINLVISGINSMISAINAIQIHVHMNPPGPGQIDFDWSGTSIPSVPTLQSGGMVTRTGMALVHEGERFSGVGGGWGPVNITVNGSVISEHDLAETVQKVLLRSKRRSGDLGLA
jgi:hypothetical protein